MAWRVWLLEFQMSHAVSHIFMISEDIHLTPVILAPNDLMFLEQFRISKGWSVLKTDAK